MKALTSSDSSRRTGGLLAHPISDGAVELLKWLAMALMLLEHINKFIWHGNNAAIFNAGRICVPIFCIVLAYNLARADTLKNGVYLRVLKRLVLSGALATPAFNLMIGVWPLNILFMLATATLCIMLIDAGGTLNQSLAAAVFVVCGALVEFWWCGIAIAVLAWWNFRTPHIGKEAALFLAIASLYLINQNGYALAALPVLCVAARMTIALPRWNYAGYAFYPLHLWLIYLWQLASEG